jgi:hypothetical protein
MRLSGFLARSLVHPLTHPLTHSLTRHALYTCVGALQETCSSPTEAHLSCAHPIGKLHHTPRPSPPHDDFKGFCNSNGLASRFNRMRITLYTTFSLTLPIPTALLSATVSAQSLMSISAASIPHSSLERQLHAVLVISLAFDGEVVEDILQLLHIGFVELRRLHVLLDSC